MIGISPTSLEPAFNAIRGHRGEDPIDAMDFLSLVREKVKVVKLDEGLLKRPVNEGFSGGEKKRNEIFHMAVLEPRLAILDETDSGLDIDALKIVADGVNALRDAERSFVLITHYQRLLNYIVPDYVHVLMDGRIVRSGGRELALQLEDQGYEWRLPSSSRTRATSGSRTPPRRPAHDRHLPDLSRAGLQRHRRVTLSGGVGRVAGSGPQEL